MCVSGVWELGVEVGWMDGGESTYREMDLATRMASGEGMAVEAIAPEGDVGSWHGDGDAIAFHPAWTQMIRIR